MIYHPDRNIGDESAAEKLKEINNAYQCLRDPVSRAKYDREVLKILPPESASMMNIVRNMANTVIRVANNIPFITMELPMEINDAAKAICT